ncbi:MAG: hypothetical protein CTY39_01390 [Hyphomicrobium sp.]|nr:MAG: hypothetical protein CTY39_01390 [Hyphomicrobium sp.]
MLILQTKRHAIRVCIPNIRGNCNDKFEGYGIVIDAAADKLLELVRQDMALMKYLDTCTVRMDGYRRIYTHLDASMTDSAWLKDCANMELCQFVFDQLQPEFEKRKSAMLEQIAEAKRVIKQFQYKVPAVITQTPISENLFSFGFRFKKNANVGDVLKNADHTESTVLAVVQPDMA